MAKAEKGLYVDMTSRAIIRTLRDVRESAQHDEDAFFLQNCLMKIQGNPCETTRKQGVQLFVGLVFAETFEDAAELVASEMGFSRHADGRATVRGSMI